MKTTTIITLTGALGLAACGKQPEPAPEPTVISPRVGGEEVESVDSFYGETEEPKRYEANEIPVAQASPDDDLVDEADEADDDADEVADRNNIKDDDEAAVEDDDADEPAGDADY